MLRIPPHSSVISSLLRAPLHVLVFAAIATPSIAQSPPRQASEIAAMFQLAAKENRLGRAKKTKVVDARPAVPGEIVVTIIKGEGKETSSPPAKTGDWVVRNRCPETGNEEILVTAEKFAERYEGSKSENGATTWREVRPRGKEMLFFRVRDDDGEFTFLAPWGSKMIARPGDAMVRDPLDPADTYRIARAAFACTYEILEAGKPG